MPNLTDMEVDSYTQYPYARETKHHSTREDALAQWS